MQKKYAKLVFVPAFLLLAAFAVPVFADDESSVDSDNTSNGSWGQKREVRQENRIENREERKENLAERREERVENREGQKEERAEKREQRREKHAERFAKFRERMDKKMDNLVEKLEAAGVDVTLIEGYLEEMDTYTDAVDAARAALDEAIENDSGIDEARVEVKEAHDALKDFYKNTLRPAIKAAVEEARDNN